MGLCLLGGSTRKAALAPLSIAAEWFGGYKRSRELMMSRACMFRKKKRSRATSLTPPPLKKLTSCRVPFGAALLSLRRVSLAFGGPFEMETWEGQASSLQYSRADH